MEKNSNAEISKMINKECIKNLNVIETFNMFSIYPIYIYNRITDDNIIPIIYIYIGGDNESTITIINHEEDKVVACMKYKLSITELEICILELVNTYMSNDKIDIERNELGTSLIEALFKTKAKDNIYYELKTRELSVNPFRVTKENIKVYGSDSSTETNVALMKILRCVS